jgi:hypothetical protein
MSLLYAPHAMYNVPQTVAAKLTLQLFCERRSKTKIPTTSNLRLLFHGSDLVIISLAALKNHSQESQAWRIVTIINATSMRILFWARERAETQSSTADNCSDFRFGVSGVSILLTLMDQNSIFCAGKKKKKKKRRD